MTTAIRGLAWREGVRYALRLIRKDPGFSAIVILTFAIGMGSATAIFTVVNGVLLRPLPYVDSSKLIAVQQHLGRNGLNPFARPKEFAAWQKQSHTLTEVAAYGWAQANLSGTEESERLDCGYASASLFHLLEVRSALGRTFALGDEQPGGPGVVLLSDAYWKRHFGGDRNVLGSSLALNGAAYSIIGVLPASFVIPDKWRSDFQVWLPLAGDSPGGPANVRVLGRLKPGVSVAQASSELDVILQPLLSRRAHDIHAVAGKWQDEVTSRVKLPLLIFLAAVNLVLMIACVNVAGLLLARATLRQNEIAVRSAIGASPAQIVSQLLAESTVLAGIGSVCGLAFAIAGKDALIAFLAGDLPAMQPITLDYRVLAFNVLIAVATGVTCGLPPAMHARSGHLNESLKANGRGTAGGGRLGRLRNLLVVVEVAIAVVVLTGAVLLLRSFQQLSRIETGFEAKGVLSLELRLTPKYRSPQDQRRFFQEVLNRLSRLPGVDSAAATTALPMGLNSSSAREVKVEGQTELTGDLDIAIVSQDYFRTIRIPLRQGRAFDESDREGAPTTAMVNETFRRQYCPATECLGRSLDGILNKKDRVTVVGVVGDVRQDLERPAQPQVYLPSAQHPSFGMALVVRTPNPPMNMARDVKGQIAAVDRTQPPFRIMPLEQFRTDSLASRRVNMWLSASFGVLALLLAALGVYGVISFSAAQQRHEIGLRMALGATQRQVFAMVVAKGLRLVASGAVVGVIFSVWLNRFLASQLWGITTTDVPTFVVVAAILGLTGLVACAVPARRASTVDPMVALRQA